VVEVVRMFPIVPKTMPAMITSQRIVMAFQSQRQIRFHREDDEDRGRLDAGAISSLLLSTTCSCFSNKRVYNISSMYAKQPSRQINRGPTYPSPYLFEIACGEVTSQSLYVKLMGIDKVEEGRRPGWNCNGLDIAL
jgi:hypothetical protein